MSKTRTSRRSPQRRSGRRTRRPSLFALSIGLVVALGVVAVALSRGGGDGDLWGVVHLDGPTLSVLEDGPDPAVGREIPNVHGGDFSKQTVSIEKDGRAKVLIFLAHWCPHCQREVPWVQSWIDDGRKPSDVDVVAIATAIDPARPNYPPDSWLERERWSSPVIVDDREQTAGKAFGVSSYPFWVFVDPEGKVVRRYAGELPIERLELVMRELVPQPAS